MLHWTVYIASNFMCSSCIRIANILLADAVERDYIFNQCKITGHRANDINSLLNSESVDGVTRGCRCVELSTVYLLSMQMRGGYRYL